MAPWGIHWPVIKVGLTLIPPLTFAATRMVMGAVVLFAVAVLLNPIELDEHDPHVLLGNSLLLGAALLWALLIVQVRRHRWQGLVDYPWSFVQSQPISGIINVPMIDCQCATNHCLRE